MCLIGGIKIRVKATLNTVEKSVHKKVGRMISFGDALPSATLTAISELGKSCKPEVLMAKNMAEEYSAFSVLSRSFAA